MRTLLLSFVSALALTAGAASPASAGAPACPAVSGGTLTLTLDRPLVRALNGAGFVLSGTHPATFARNRVLRLPVTGGSLAAGERIETSGGLFLHAGMHRLELGRVALAPALTRTRLVAKVGRGRAVALATTETVPCTRPRATAAPVVVTRAGAAALRRALGTARPRAGDLLGSATLRAR